MGNRQSANIRLTDTLTQIDDRLKKLEEKERSFDEEEERMENRFNALVLSSAQTQELLASQKLVQEKDEEIAKLKKELEILQTSLNKLENDRMDTAARVLSLSLSEVTTEKETVQSKNTAKEKDEALQLLSEQQVRVFVDDLLKKQSVNMGYLPDWAEKRIYNNILNMLLGIIKQTLDNTAVKIIGHELRFSLMPSKVCSAAASATSATSATATTNASNKTN
jgi:myosin heavy subunit